ERGRPWHGGCGRGGAAGRGGGGRVRGGRGGVGRGRGSAAAVHAARGVEHPGAGAGGDRRGPATVIRPSLGQGASAGAAPAVVGVPGRGLHGPVALAGGGGGARGGGPSGRAPTAARGAAGRGARRRGLARSVASTKRLFELFL